MVWGTVTCIVVAGVFAFLFQSSHFKDFVPFLFIPIVGLVALRFGTWSGVICTVACVLIFADFLFAPFYTLRVNDFEERNSLVWMVIGGLALSEVLGAQPPADRDPTDSSKKRT